MSVSLHLFHVFSTRFLGERLGYGRWGEVPFDGIFWVFSVVLAAAGLDCKMALKRWFFSGFWKPPTSDIFLSQPTIHMFSPPGISIVCEVSFMGLCQFSVWASSLFQKERRVAKTGLFNVLEEAQFGFLRHFSKTRPVSSKNWRFLMFWSKPCFLLWLFFPIKGGRDREVLRLGKMVNLCLVGSFWRKPSFYFEIF